MRSGRIILGVVMWAVAGFAYSQAPPPGSIYMCVDTSDRKVTSEREIGTCKGPQTVHWPNGKVTELAPAMTQDEIRALGEAQRRQSLDAEAKRVAERADRDLLRRYPNDEALRKAREAELDPVRGRMRASQARLAALERERKPLVQQAEFYVGKPLPPKLRSDLDANDASVGAQNDLLHKDQVELADIDARYDKQLIQLKALWPAGAATPTGVPTGARSSPARK